MKKRSVFARRCLLEALEDRRLMAGDVFAQVVKGNLVIRGDDAANAIEVTAGLNAGEVVVTGVNDGNGAATRVNGSSNGAVTLNGFNGGIDFTMNGGNDNVLLDGLASRALSIDLGRGNDVFTVTGHQVNGDMTVRGSDGDDEGTVRDLTVTGSLTIDLGEGNNKLTSRDSNIGRDAKYLGGRGADVIDLLSINFTGNCVISLGDGENRVFGTNSGANRMELKAGKNNDFVQLEVCSANWLTVDMGNGDNKVNLYAPSVARELRVAGGSGVDDVAADENTIEGNAIFDLGDGNNRLSNQLNVKGDVVVRGGRGADEIGLDGQYTGPVTYRSLKVELGDGANALTVNEIAVRGKAEVRGGKNNDSTNWTSVGFDSFFADLGGGANTFNLSSGNVGRSFELRTGAGSDTGQISDTTVTGNTLVNLGDGDNGSFTLQHSTFQGDVTFQGGKGTDFLVLYDIHALRSLKTNFGGGANRTSVLGITVDGKADFIGGSGVDTFEVVGITAASLNVAMGKGNDTLMLGFSTTTQSTRIDGEDGQDTYLVGDSGTNNLASFNRRSFETLGTFHPA